MITPFKSKKGLGRGLSSLIGDNDVSDSKTLISISSIIRNKYQPRKNFEKDSLEELTNSIRARGIIQPIIVRKSDDYIDKFEIVAWERRWQAAQNAGLHEVPVVVIKADNLKSLEFAIVENVQRKDLNPIEEAEGYKKLIDDFGYDQDKVSKFIGKSRSHVSNFLRILTLPEKIKKLISEEKLTQGHAKILVGLDNAELLADKVVQKELSVRQIENLVKVFKFNKNNAKNVKNANVLDLESQLSDKLGGGSLTALPIIETQEGDVSAYIPTNVISITDGQLYLEPDLFNSGIRPAVNAGLSVTRVGSSAQRKAMKTVSGSLKGEMAQYSSLQTFAQFGTDDLDAITRQQLARGERLTELLKQNENQNLSFENQVSIFYVANQGGLDDINIEKISEFETGWYDFIAANIPDVMKDISESGELSDDSMKKMDEAIKTYKGTFGN